MLRPPVDVGFTVGFAVGTTGSGFAVGTFGRGFEATVGDAVGGDVGSAVGSAVADSVADAVGGGDAAALDLAFGSIAGGVVVVCVGSGAAMGGLAGAGSAPAIWKATTPPPTPSTAIASAAMTSVLPFFGCGAVTASPT